MFKERCLVLDNKKIAPSHWVLKLKSGRIAKNARPGQFVQILCSDNACDPLLPRPFSFLDASENSFEVLYQEVGKGTLLLSKMKKGASLDIVGPLGNGFTLAPRTKTKALLVGGGVGIPPLYHLAKTFLSKKIHKKDNIEVFLGARTKSFLLCEKEFKKLGVKLFMSTDDGSKGERGFVTTLLSRRLQSPAFGAAEIYACGPNAMLQAVGAVSEKFKTACEVSVEVPMACGFGACLGCAIKVKTLPGPSSAGSSRLVGKKTPAPGCEAQPAQEHRFAIACTEGPVFKASDILWA